MIVYRRLKSVPVSEYFAYCILLLLSGSLGMMVIDNPVLQRAIDLTLLGVILLTLVFILVIIRQLQPDYARHPLFYSFLPVIIFPFYTYFITSDVLASITHATLQATAMLVFSGLIFLYWKTVERGYFLLIAIICFLSAFSLYWFADSYQEIIQPTIHLLTGAGMILVCLKFPAVLIEHKR